MQYCINALLRNNNEIMQYCIINNDIALIMHYRALLQMPDYNGIFHHLGFYVFKMRSSYYCMSQIQNSFHHRE